MTITVANTGPGIEEAEIDKVFEQFYRVEKSRSIEHGGSGLGLAIAKRIVELHNGTIKLESQPGHVDPGYGLLASGSKDNLFVKRGSGWSLKHSQP